MGKHKHSKIMSFLNILGEAEIKKIPKTWEKQIPILQEKHEGKQTFQNYRFLKYFR